jgi:hypothetical protein
MRHAWIARGMRAIAIATIKVNIFLIIKHLTILIILLAIPDSLTYPPCMALYTKVFFNLFILKYMLTLSTMPFVFSPSSVCCQ